MKKAIVILLSILLMSTMSGCWSYHELKDYAIVMGMAVDKGSGENFKMTVQTALPSQIKTSSKEAGGGSGGGKTYWNMTLEGETMFKLVRDFSHLSSHKLYFPHCKAMIFSKEIAEQGIRPYQDWLARDPEPRGSMWLFVSRGEAGKILDTEPKLEKIPAVNLEELTDIQKYNDETYTANLVKFVKCLMSKTKAPVLPFVELTGDEEVVVSISGGAVFKRDKLIGELDKVETRGLLWVEGEVKNGIVTVDDPVGEGKADLEINQCCSAIISEVKDGEVKITVKVRAQSNIGAQTSANKLATPDNMKSLGNEQNDAIKKEIEASVKKAKALKADIFGFGEEVHHTHPKEWAQLEDQWDTVFPTIEVEIKVDSEVYGAGIVPKPSTPVS